MAEPTRSMMIDERTAAVRSQFGDGGIVTLQHRNVLSDECVDIIIDRAAIAKLAAFVGLEVKEENHA
jgi:hypothetical protein